MVGVRGRDEQRMWSWAGVFGLQLYNCTENAFDNGWQWVQRDYCEIPQ